ncbi:hypothetical protein BLS_008024 [Venturia inaequalis]|uniref:Methylated-DNA--protein-cysteine methyltransferase n=1 Tax=Venturia inaequalis TaxID=5025 RepID=A0A8H3Z2N1_VENIN|nr:hypothetical protein BLS_008024 [Venturia inaequalis]RDI87820.1 hypothetical protein Vi05172_g2199 [Venturia inaequalis]
MPPKKAAPAVSPELQKLQNSWKTMFQKTLPEAAISKSSSQPKWPVHVDHCFARIILDKVVGGGKAPWMTVIKSPAYKNMSGQQLKDAIKLGEDILSGHADLVELDEESLMVRGKKGKRNTLGRKSGKMSKEEMDRAERERRQTEEDEEKDNIHKQKEEFKAEKSTTNAGDKENEPTGCDTTSSTQVADEARTTSIQDTPPPVDKKRKLSDEETSTPPPTKIHKTSTHNHDPALQSTINTSSKTSFQKSVLSLLLQIPPGCYTTYNLMSKHLSSSPRAVGNALRNNPFAPEVPCHRVLATGGGIGGFGGSWGKKGEEGENDKEKYRLLRSEGVKFDGKGRVVGSPWNGFS